jgi:protein-L-isoaspartate(D-aspartate) O-methyltransferase
MHKRRYLNLDRSWKNLIERLTKEGLLRSPQVIRAMRIVSRERFLPDNMKSYAALDSPLPIGFGQTISAPRG